MVYIIPSFTKEHNYAIGYYSVQFEIRYSLLRCTDFCVIVY